MEPRLYCSINEVKANRMHRCLQTLRRAALQTFVSLLATGWRWQQQNMM